MFSCSGDARFEENDDLIFLNSVCIFSVYQSLCLMCLHPVFLYKYIYVFHKQARRTHKQTEFSCSQCARSRAEETSHRKKELMVKTEVRTLHCGSGMGLRHQCLNKLIQELHFGKHQ